MKFCRTISAAALLGWGVVHAADLPHPPLWPVPDIKPNGTKMQPVTGVTLGLFQMVFEKTSFDDIFYGLGVAPISRQGDDSDYLLWVCYTMQALQARIWFISGELGGGKYIDGLAVKRIKPDEAEIPYCPKPSAQIMDASIDNEIWLGQSITMVQPILGTPTNTSASTSYYFFAGKDGGIYVSSVLALVVEKRRITELHARYYVKK